LRAATPQDGLFCNDQAVTFTALLGIKQISVTCRKIGLGFSGFILARNFPSWVRLPSGGNEQAVCDDWRPKEKAIGIILLCPPYYLYVNPVQHPLMCNDHLFSKTIKNQ